MSAQTNPLAGKVRCPKCKGTAKVNEPIVLRRGDGEHDVYIPADCQPCKGEGFVLEHRVCRLCGKFKSCCLCLGKKD